MFFFEEQRAKKNQMHFHLQIYQVQKIDLIIAMKKSFKKDILLNLVI